MKGVLLFVLGCFVACCCRIPLDSSFLRHKVAGSNEELSNRRKLLQSSTCGYFYNFDSVIVPSVNPLNISISQAEGSLSLVNSNCHYGPGSCIQGTNHLTDQNYRFHFDCPSNPFTISFWQYITEQSGSHFIFNDGPAGGAPTGDDIFYFQLLSSSYTDLIWHNRYSYTQINVSTFPPLNTWTYLSIVFTSTNVDVYVLNQPIISNNFLLGYKYSTSFNLCHWREL